MGGGVRGVLETGALVTREAGKVTRDRDVGAVAKGRQEHPGRWCLTSPWCELFFTGQACSCNTVFKPPSQVCSSGFGAFDVDRLHEDGVCGWRRNKLRRGSTKWRRGLLR